MAVAVNEPIDRRCLPMPSVPPPDSSDNVRRPLRRRLAWLLRRVFPPLFATIVVVLLVRNARHIDWAEVWEAALDQSPGQLVVAGLIGALAYACYACYELLARREVGHSVPKPVCLAIGAVSYACNLTLGSIIGGLGFRYRLYSRFGLAGATIARCIGFSILTNWLGYLLVAGIVFANGHVPVPPDWEIGQHALRSIGVVMILAALSYVSLSMAYPGRRIEWAGRGFSLVRGSTALIQIAVSAMSWMLISAVVWMLLDGVLSYPRVLGLLTIAAIAGVATHIPAGLGVTEAVFIALAGHEVPHATLIAALLTYRLLFYFGPLLLAIPGYIALELVARRRASPAQASGATSDRAGHRSLQADMPG